MTRFSVVARAVLAFVSVASLACSGAAEGDPSADAANNLEANGAAGSAGSAGSEHAEPVCAAGAAEACDADGTPGTRTCAADGLAWGACTPKACKGGEVAPCTPKDGVTGLRRCEAPPSGAQPAWSSACEKTVPCEEGDTMSCGPAQPGIGPITASCRSFDGVWMFPPGGCATPLVLSFDDAPVAFTRPAGSFDLVGVAASHETDWVSAATPWLVLDRNGNGAIDDGSELFGSMTVLASGARAPNGFAALAELDADGDGAITPADPAWEALRLWSDANQDRASAPRELRSLDAAGVVSIDVRYRVEPRCAVAACEMERARFTWRRGDTLRAGAVVDVHFAVR